MNRIDVGAGALFLLSVIYFFGGITSLFALLIAVAVHEFGHIVYGHMANQDGTTEEDEKNADSFARNALIPDEAFQQFVIEERFDKLSIIEFAKMIGIDAGIVVGRLQKERYIPFSWHGDLKTKYELTA